MYYELTINRSKPPKADILEHIRQVHSDLPIVEKFSDDVLEYGFSIKKIDNLLSVSAKNDPSIAGLTDPKLARAISAEKEKLAKQEKFTGDTSQEKPYEPDKPKKL